MPQVVEQTTSNKTIHITDKLREILVLCNDDVSNDLLSLNGKDSEHPGLLDVHPSIKDSFLFITGVRNKKEVLKVARFARKIIPHCSPTALESFSNRYKAVTDLLSGNTKFVLVSGLSVADVYKSIPHKGDSGTGQLGKSCMNNKHPLLYSLYTQNPDKVQLLVLLDESGEMKGRALVWKTEGGYKFMDKIYTYHPNDVELFKLLGDKEGIWYKKNQNTSAGRRENGTYSFKIICGNESKRENIIVALTDKSFGIYPYLDSLCYYNPLTGFLSNDRDSIEAGILLTRTDGSAKDADDD